jgi:spermidine synthase
MTRSFLRLVVVIFLGSGLLPLVTLACSRVRLGTGDPMLAIHLALLGVLAALTTIFFSRLLKSWEGRIDSSAREQAEFLDTFPSNYVDLAIVGSAALSLFLELAVIRWQATVFEFFAFYKNFGLLCCFAGLGLGYALAKRDRILLQFTVPLLALQFALMIGLRFGMTPEGLKSLNVLPFTEQLNMGIGFARTIQERIAIYFFLSVTFLITAAAFIPLGQLCGRLMERQEKLRGYGLNLVGSLIGVVLMFVASSLLTPPLVWYVVCFLIILLFYPRKWSPQALGMGWVAVATVVLAWPASPLWQRIYSPYQLLEVGYSDRGLMLIRAAGHYYQRVHDFSGADTDANSPEKRAREYYDLPYQLHPNDTDVAVVGAGAGNDVAAALRAGAQHVDAIEIDPVILALGREYHPEKPYLDIRVRSIVTDARSFLRTTDNHYDLIIYGLLDSHTLLSQASSVRLDSFVYTVEALREARSRLKDDGALALSFSVINLELGCKIYKMMEEAFDGHGPISVQAGYDGAVVFFQSRSGDLVEPPDLMRKTGFRDLSSKFANQKIKVDESTDDWPFFYMPRRIYPVSYLPALGLMLAGMVFLCANFLPEKPHYSHLPFFFLGAGFMLVETKGITEAGLKFGNTWQVVGIVIAGILVMAFLANCVVQWVKVKSPLVASLLLLASLAFGWYVSRYSGLSVGRWGDMILLTCPLFFSGIVFSTLVASQGEISTIMTSNLLGAICGGLVEYNSMYFGFQFLYLIAMCFYVLALVTSYLGPQDRALGWVLKAELR